MKFMWDVNVTLKSSYQRKSRCGLLELENGSVLDEVALSEVPLAKEFKDLLNQLKSNTTKVE